MKKERKKSKFFSEFKAFITRGNVLDMAVGVIVGGAFTSIVNALSNHILKPIINWVLALIFGSNSLEGIYTFLKKAYVLDNGVPTDQVDLANSIYIDWGEFINAIINFILIAFVLFCIIKGINSFHQKMEEAIKKAKKEEEEPAPEPEPEPIPEPDPQIVLLTEIRDLLSKEDKTNDEQK